MTAKTTLNDNDNKTIKCGNMLQAIRLKMQQALEMVIEKIIDHKSSNFSTSDKVAVFILDLVDVRDMQPIVLDEHYTKEFIISIFK